MKNIIVQKFGGTSVQNKESRKLVIKKIKNTFDLGYVPVVVVSAMGRYGESYATDTLLSLLKKDTSNLVKDFLLNCGENISNAILCSELNSYGLKAVPITGWQAGIKTNNVYGEAEIDNVNTDFLVDIINKKEIPIISGFQGISQEGFLTTLGRGGSDTTAAILGAALKAKYVEIYTDVDGMMSADPRIVKDASLIQEINYDEMLNFADQGAKVIHPRAVYIARRANIPVIIKNTFSECNGTIISDKYTDNTRPVTGITSSDDKIQITINTDSINILKVLADINVSIDLINIFPKQKIFTIVKGDFEKVEGVLKRFNFEYNVIKDCCKLSIIGNGMHDVPGIMSNILECLYENNIEVLQTADSNNTIWCLVNNSNKDKAIVVLHEKFKKTMI